MENITSEGLIKEYNDFFNKPTKAKLNKLYKLTMFKGFPKSLKYYYAKIMLYTPNKIQVDIHNDQEKLISFEYKPDQYISLYIKEHGLIVEHDNIDLFDIKSMCGMLAVKKENNNWYQKYYSFNKNRPYELKKELIK